MKRTRPIIGGLMLLALGLAGCARFTAPVKPPVGFIYTNYKAPLMTDYHGGDLGSKTGTSTTQYLRIPFVYVPLSLAWNDAAMHSAAERGGIKTVKAADYEYFSILGIYHEFRVRVYGD